MAELGKKTLVVDLDPQCNLTIFALPDEVIWKTWSKEDDYIDDFNSTREKNPQFEDVLKEPRSVHFVLKPTEDGTAELPSLPPPFALTPNLHLLPGRLTLHFYEDKIASRWSDIYQGDPLAIRTVTRARSIAEEYAEIYGYDIVIFDTSPSLGALNKAVISLVDGFVVPCNPDMFSLYGIRNIGNSLSIWKKQFETIFHLLSVEKRSNFPEDFVRFLGFTIYNAKKYGGTNEWDLATAHYNFAKQIPTTIKQYIKKEIRSHLSSSQLETPIGETAVMHTHSTLPSMAQKYHLPIWKVPSAQLEGSDRATIAGNRATYEGTRLKYQQFAKDVLNRLSTLDI
ncbi:AAA family ATPase [Bradyrhizobium sp. 83002]|uniref:ParA family protein n=1 Tax=Bradyrhizobium aeschynomenes TaxID=2734909 RepID=UPI00155168AA|nr:AAA family ATPase [Bradyrhizobium aeschynomenes]